MRNATPVLPFKMRRPTRRHYFLRANFRPFSFFTRTTHAKINPVYTTNNASTFIIVQLPICFRTVDKSMLEVLHIIECISCWTVALKATWAKSWMTTLMERLKGTDWRTLNLPREKTDVLCNRCVHNKRTKNNLFQCHRSPATGNESLHVKSKGYGHLLIDNGQATSNLYWLQGKCCTCPCYAASYSHLSTHRCGISNCT